MTSHDSIIMEFERQMKLIPEIKDTKERIEKVEELMNGIFIYCMGYTAGTRLFNEYKEAIHEQIRQNSF